MTIAIGQTSWGVPLNAYLTTFQAGIAANSTSISNHVSNIPADPHGDRAYANSLVTPITSSVNTANGYVVTNGSNQIGGSQLPAGGFKNSFWDVVHDFGANYSGGASAVTAIQNALNAAASAGGGEVWVPDGTYIIDTGYLYMPENTWLHLSDGAVMVRQTPVSGGSAPSYMLTNINLAGASLTPAYGNMRVSGGLWNAVGSGLSSACTIFFFCQAGSLSSTNPVFGAEIEKVNVNGVFNSPVIELNGCIASRVRDVQGTNKNAPNSANGSTPMVRINSTYSNTTPSGMASGVYTGQACEQIAIENVGYNKATTYQAYTYVVDSDLGPTSGTADHELLSIMNCSTNCPVAATPVGGPSTSSNAWLGSDVNSPNAFNTWPSSFPFTIGPDKSVWVSTVGVQSVETSPSLGPTAWTVLFSYDLEPGYYEIDAQVNLVPTEADGYAEIGFYGTATASSLTATVFEFAGDASVNTSAALDTGNAILLSGLGSSGSPNIFTGSAIGSGLSIRSYPIRGRVVVSSAGSFVIAARIILGAGTIMDGTVMRLTPYAVP